MTDTLNTGARSVVELARAIRRNPALWLKATAPARLAGLNCHRGWPTVCPEGCSCSSTGDVVMCRHSTRAPHGQRIEGCLRGYPSPSCPPEGCHLADCQIQPLRRRLPAGAIFLSEPRRTTVKDKKLTTKIETARADLATATGRADAARSEYVRIQTGPQPTDALATLLPELELLRAQVGMERLARELGRLENQAALRAGDGDAAACDLECIAADVGELLAKATAHRAKAAELGLRPDAVDLPEQIKQENDKAKAFVAAADGRLLLADQAWRRLEAAALAIDDVNPVKPRPIPVKRDAIGGLHHEPYERLELVRAALAETEQPRMPSQDKLDKAEHRYNEIVIAREQQLRELEERQADLAKWKAKTEKRAAKAEAAQRDAARSRQKEAAKHAEQSRKERDELVASYRARGDVAPEDLLPDPGTPSKIDGDNVRRGAGEL